VTGDLDEAAKTTGFFIRMGNVVLKSIWVYSYLVIVRAFMILRRLEAGNASGVRGSSTK
jgi:hypothetical protein